MSKKTVFLPECVVFLGATAARTLFDGGVLWVRLGLQTLFCGLRDNDSTENFWGLPLRNLR